MQLKDVSVKLQTTVQPLFTSRKIAQEFLTGELKPRLIDQQCVVYHFKCDRCNTAYVGYIRWQLFVCVNGHRTKTFSNYWEKRPCQCAEAMITDKQAWFHGDLRNCFKVLETCQNKFDCFVNEMLLIKQLQPCLNIQSDSNRKGLSNFCKLMTLDFNLLLKLHI